MQLQDTDLTIIIATHNSRAFAERCLHSLRDQEHLDIVVVDNASTDGTIEAIRDHFPAVHVVANEQNVGFSAANNLGLAGTRGRYVLFLNPDTEVTPDVLSYLVHFMDEHPEVGAVGPFVQLPDGSMDDAAHRGFPTPWNSLCYFSGLTRLFPHVRVFSGYTQGWMDMTGSHAVDAICGCCMLVRRDAGEQVGWWDEDYFFYGEDLDLCYRLREARWAIYFIPEVTVLHHKGTSSGIRRESHHVTTASRETRVAATHYRFAAMRTFYRKHLDARYPQIVTRMVMAAIAIKEWKTLRDLRWS